MSTFQFGPAHGFPVGLTVQAFEDKGQQPSGSPMGPAAVASGVVGGTGALAIAGLTEGTRYWAVGQVNGSYRWMSIYVPRDFEEPVDERAAFEVVDDRLDLVEGDSVRKSSDSRIDAKIAFAAPVNANAWVRFGSGTGTLTDKAGSGPMSIKSKIDTVAGSTPTTPIQVNLNIVDGTLAGAAHGFVVRVDVNDTDPLKDGDTVALWPDVFIWGASGRPVWAMNPNVSIVAGSGYTGAAVVSEFGLVNDDDPAQEGGLVHYVSHGAFQIRFAELYGGASGDYRVEHNILMSSSTPPATNAFYYGPLAAGNAPSGTALFKVTAAGAVFAGPLATFGQTLGAGADAIAVQRSSNTFPRLVMNTDGRIFMGSGSAAPDANIGRSGANIVTIGVASSCALEIGTVANASSGYLQMWELAGDPSAPSGNNARLYLRDNGAGKTQLCVRFPTGAVQVVSTEP